MARCVILHITDTHCGMRNGMLAPHTSVTGDDGEKVEIGELSDYSKWVWEAWLTLLERTSEYAGSDPVIVVHTGDVIHGEKHVGQEYVYTAWRDQQVEIAHQAIQTIRKLPTLAGLVTIYGTAAHDYGQSQGTKDFAAEMARYGFPVECVSYADFDVLGLRVDATHHGPGIGKGASNTRAGAARAYVMDMARADMERGNQAPGLVLRGHVHQRLTEPVVIPWGNRQINVMVSIGAPLTGPNEYAIQFTTRRGQPYVETGGALISIENGRVTDYEWVTRVRETRKRIIVAATAYNSGNGSQGDGQLG